MQNKSLEEMEERILSHPWYGKPKKLKEKKIGGTGGVKSFKTPLKIQIFLRKYGDTIPESKIQSGLLYGNIKEWLVTILMKEGKPFWVPFFYWKQDSISGEEKWEGMTTKDFLKRKGIKIQEIRCIQLLIRR